MPSALAIAAHPDDIEFVIWTLSPASGQLLALLNLSRGELGSVSPARMRRRAGARRRRGVRRRSSAQFYPPICGDLAIHYDTPTLRRVAAVVRQAQPRIVLAHSPEDYMEDHMNASRLAVTAAFSRGMPNFATDPPLPPFHGEVAVYHAAPHGLCDGLRRLVVPGAFVDTGSVLAKKREALAAHASQKEWLDVSQGMDSYLASMEDMSRQVGLLSGKFEHARAGGGTATSGFRRQKTTRWLEALGERYSGECGLRGVACRPWVAAFMLDAHLQKPKLSLAGASFIFASAGLAFIWGLYFPEILTPFRIG
ncbi:MAG: LmbE family protein [Verrucomicrobiales bacterium]